MSVCFNEKNSNFYILLEGGIILERSFLDLEVVKTYRIFAHTHRKILEFFIDQETEPLYFRLEDGTLVTKNTSNLTAP